MRRDGLRLTQSVDLFFHLLFSLFLLANLYKEDDDSDNGENAVNDGSDP